METENTNKVIAFSYEDVNLKASTTMPMCSGAYATVNIRPAPNYNGGFGFDWLRFGDTNLSGDVDYKNIMGWTDINGNNHYDASKYGQLKDSFEKVPHPSLENENYYVPIMTLEKNTTAKLSLQVMYNLASPKIKIKYDTTYFKLDKEELDFTNETVQGSSFIQGAKKMELEVTSLSNRSKTSYIDFHLDDNNETFAGRVKIIPNNNSKELEVIFIQVKTRLNVVENVKQGSVYTSEVNHAKNVFSQSHVNFSHKMGEIDLTDDKTLESFSEYRDGQKVLKLKTSRNATTNIFDYLESKVDYTSVAPYYRVYLLDEAFYDPDSSDYIWGRAKDLNSRVVGLFSAPHHLLQSKRPSALLVHELLHAEGLRHSFDAGSKFSYIRNKTNNILDYSYQEGKSAIETWQWQWAKINPSLASFVKPSVNVLNQST